MTDSKHYASHCTVIDVAVIGAGLAGLVCAQNLQQAGYRVAVVEKSRGVGGRLATRRLQGVHADHGVRYLNHQGELSEYLIQSLLKQGVIQSWIDQRVSPKEEVGREDSTQGICYSAPTGLTAVAKFLANGLQIHHEQRLVSLTAIDNQWQLELEAAQPASLSARAVVLAIPAPQALSVLEPLLAVGLPAELVQQVASVQFDPCLSAMAAYSATVKLEHPAIHLTNSPDLAWISLETTKRSNQQPTILVAQSTAALAERSLVMQDLTALGKQLLEQSAMVVPELQTVADSLIELQVHRWRYAFVRQPLSQQCLLTALPLPLACCGDWCGGQQIENALGSGLTAAGQISELLNGAASVDKLAARQLNLPNLIQQLLGELS